MEWKLFLSTKWNKRMSVNAKMGSSQNNVLTTLIIFSYQTVEQIEAILMPNNKHQTIMTVYANNRCIYQENMS